jgi:hypothetical protein
MSIFDKLKSQLIDVIEWLDDSSDTMVYRFYRPENEIMNGARLVVRESQVAAFVNQGQLADSFQAAGVEVWVSKPVQGRGVFRFHTHVHRSQMGNKKSDHAARCGVWAGSIAGVWLVCSEGERPGDVPERCGGHEQPVQRG